MSCLLLSVEKAVLPACERLNNFEVHGVGPYVLLSRGNCALIVDVITRTHDDLDVQMTYLLGYRLNTLITIMEHFAGEDLTAHVEDSVWFLVNDILIDLTPNLRYFTPCSSTRMYYCVLNVLEEVPVGNERDIIEYHADMVERGDSAKVVQSYLVRLFVFQKGGTMGRLNCQEQNVVEAISALQAFIDRQSM